MLAGAVLLSEFLRGEAALNRASNGVGDDGIGCNGVGRLGVFNLLGVHTDKRDIVDEAEVAHGFLSSVVEEAGEAFDIISSTGLEGELLEPIVVDDTGGAYMLAAGVED